MKVLIVVTHLLGSGHLSRALTLGRALGATGHEVKLASGGMPVSHLQNCGVDVLQLPPVRSDGVNFTQLLDENAAPVSDTLLQQRKKLLQGCLDDIRPDVVITELFPFGRRVLAAEFRELLSAAHGQTPRPLICASIRDILAPPSKPAKAEFARDLIATYYDAVLVHSDPSVAPLEASWPVTEELSARLRYTGFVAPAPASPHPDALGRNEILVTTGGGSVGMRLFETALAAARTDSTRQWRLLVGGQDADARIDHLQAQATTNATVCNATPVFRQMLYHASVSVSFCGYNTALDVLQAGTPAVFVPFDDGGEVEQTLRARSLAKQPGIEMLTSEKLSADRLLDCIGTVTHAPRRAPRRDSLQGAAHTVEILEQLVADKR